MEIFNDFSIGLFVILVTIFVILWFLMSKFAWKPILNFLEEREQGIKNALDSAELAKKEIQNLNADNERLLNEARVEKDTMLRDAREIKQNIISEAKQEAKEQAILMIKNAKIAIKQEQNTAFADIKNKIADLSIEIAKKVIKNDLKSQDEQMKFVDNILKNITLN